jgi:hypothetical protein
MIPRLIGHVWQALALWFIAVVILTFCWAAFRGAGKALQRRNIAALRKQAHLNRIEHSKTVVPIDRGGHAHRLDNRERGA